MMDAEKRTHKAREAFCKLEDIWRSSGTHLNENEHLSCVRESSAAVWLRVTVCDWGY
jgi:hypothetical protein